VLQSFCVLIPRLFAWLHQIWRPLPERVLNHHLHDNIRNLFVLYLLTLLVVAGMLVVVYVDNLTGTVARVLILFYILGTDFRLRIEAVVWRTSKTNCLEGIIPNSPLVTTALVVVIVAMCLTLTASETLSVALHFVSLCAGLVALLQNPNRTFTVPAHPIGVGIWLCVIVALGVTSIAISSEHAELANRLFLVIMFVVLLKPMNQSSVSLPPWLSCSTELEKQQLASMADIELCAVVGNSCAHVSVMSAAKGDISPWIDLITAPGKRKSDGEEMPVRVYGLVNDMVNEIKVKIYTPFRKLVRRVSVTPFRASVLTLAQSDGLTQANADFDAMKAMV
jgi:hypothetical protein